MIERSCFWSFVMVEGEHFHKGWDDYLLSVSDGFVLSPLHEYSEVSPAFLHRHVLLKFDNPVSFFHVRDILSHFHIKLAQSVSSSRDFIFYICSTSDCLSGGDLGFYSNLPPAQFFHSLGLDDFLDDIVFGCDVN